MLSFQMMSRVRGDYYSASGGGPGGQYGYSQQNGIGVAATVGPGGVPITAPVDPGVRPPPPGAPTGPPGGSYNY
jgi:hypothetical protein